MADGRLRFALLCAAFVLAGSACASKPKPAEFDKTIVTRSDGGALEVTTLRGVKVDGWIRQVVEMAWEGYCNATNYLCDPSERYAVLALSSGKPNCSANIYGRMIVKKSAAKEKRGVAVSYRCAEGPAGGSLYVENASAYGPNETPPLIYFDGPMSPQGRHDIDAAIPIEAVSPEQLPPAKK